ncbi:MAG TPA: porin, partial [Geminicoccaceae bacterium]|nr:porin [Geminicoccaceae bacterium]
MGQGDSTVSAARLRRAVRLALTAAVAGGGHGTATTPAAAQATLRAGGYPELTLTGYVRFLAHGGQLDDARQDGRYSRSPDFTNDTELHVVAQARSEETGVEYGATVEFEADTDEVSNTDETWIFFTGGWGELRLGDDDGAADRSVGAQEVAAGTGGIDGAIINRIAVPVVF